MWVDGTSCVKTGRAQVVVRAVQAFETILGLGTVQISTTGVCGIRLFFTPLCHIMCAGLVTEEHLL